MNSNRRKFLRNVTVGAGTLLTGIDALANVTKDEADKSLSASYEKEQQRFNMCGYAAPKLNVVRIGVIGLGMRGSGAVEEGSVILMELRLPPFVMSYPTGLLQPRKHWLKWIVPRLRDIVAPMAGKRSAKARM